MSDGMHAIDGILDQAGGAALKTAARLALQPARAGGRSDFLVSGPPMRWSSLRTNAMDEKVGCLGRNGVKPHINLTTTIEGLKNELGAGPADSSSPCRSRRGRWSDLPATAPCHEFCSPTRW